MSKSLSDIKVINLAINLPGPLAVQRLQQWGARVVKVEPPTGDPLASHNEGFYDELSAGQDVRRINLKEGSGKKELEILLKDADLLFTSFRKSALKKLGLTWGKLHSKFKQLCWVAIFGYPAPNEEKAGHDLTYQAEKGLVRPPELPISLFADIAGAYDAAMEAMRLLYERKTQAIGSFAKIYLSGSLDVFAKPIQYGLTTPHSTLGGNSPAYNLYKTKTNWVALAALESHFWENLQELLRVKNPDYEMLQSIFLKKSAKEWVKWALENDIPLVMIS